MIFFLSFLRNLAIQCYQIIKKLNTQMMSFIYLVIHLAIQCYHKSYPNTNRPTIFLISYQRYQVLVKIKMLKTPMIFFLSFLRNLVIQCYQIIKKLKTQMFFFINLGIQFYHNSKRPTIFLISYQRYQVLKMLNTQMMSFIYFVIHLAIPCYQILLTLGSKVKQLESVLVKCKPLYLLSVVGPITDSGFMLIGIGLTITMVILKKVVKKVKNIQATRLRQHYPLRTITVERNTVVSQNQPKTEINQPSATLVQQRSLVAVSVPEKEKTLILPYRPMLPINYNISEEQRLFLFHKRLVQNNPDLFRSSSSKPIVEISESPKSVTENSVVPYVGEKSLVPVCSSSVSKNNLGTIVPYVSERFLVPVSRARQNIPSQVSVNKLTPSFNTIFVLRSDLTEEQKKIYELPWYTCLDDPKIKTSHIKQHYLNLFVSINNKLNDNILKETVLNPQLLKEKLLDNTFKTKKLLEILFNCSEIATLSKFLKNVPEGVDLETHVNSTVAVYFSTFAHGSKSNKLAYLQKQENLPEFKDRQVNLWDYISLSLREKIQDTDLISYLQNAHFKTMTKITEIIILQKLNNFFKPQGFYVSLVNEQNYLQDPSAFAKNYPNTLNVTDNTNPDFIIHLKYIINGYTSIAMDCKHPNGIKVKKRCIVHVTHNRENLEKLTVECYNILKDQIQEYNHNNARIPTDLKNKLKKFESALSENIKNFENTKDLDSFIASYKKLFTDNISVIVECKFKVTLPEILTSSDFNEQLLEHMKTLFIAKVLENFNENSDLCKKLFEVLFNLAKEIGQFEQLSADDLFRIFG